MEFASERERDEEPDVKEIPTPKMVKKRLLSSLMKEESEEIESPYSKYSTKELMEEWECSGKIFENLGSKFNEDRDTLEFLARTFGCKIVDLREVGAMCTIVGQKKLEELKEEVARLETKNANLQGVI